jgi:hypothetical protein
MNSLLTPRRGLRRAEHEITVRSKPIGKARKHRAFRHIVEIDQHVAAEDHVEDPEPVATVEQVVHAEGDGAANLRADLPDIADLLEIFHQQRDRQPSLNFELAILPFARFRQRLLDEIRGDDFDGPADEFAVPLGKFHGKRIGLLPRRRRCAPDPDAALFLPSCHQSRQHLVDEIVERHLVARNTIPERSQPGQRATSAHARPASSWRAPDATAWAGRTPAIVA